MYFVSLVVSKGDPTLLIFSSFVRVRAVSVVLLKSSYCRERAREERERERERGERERERARNKKNN